MQVAMVATAATAAVGGKVAMVARVMASVVCTTREGIWASTKPCATPCGFSAPRYILVPNRFGVLDVVIEMAIKKQVALPSF